MVNVVGLAVAIAGIVVLKALGENTLRSTILKYLGSEESSEVLVKLTLYGLYSLFGLVFLSSLGISVQSLLMTGGLVTLAISFAAQTVISNGISGLLLMIERPVKIGDYVEVKNANVRGTVISISLFSTALRLDNGEVARIPNSTFFSDIIINKSKTLARRIEVELTVGYDDVDKAIEVLKKYAERDPDILAEPRPEIYVLNYEDYGVNIRINVWVPRQKWYEVFKRIRRDILSELKKASISLPYPTYVIVKTDRK